MGFGAEVVGAFVLDGALVVVGAIVVVVGAIVVVVGAAVVVVVVGVAVLLEHAVSSASVAMVRAVESFMSLKSKSAVEDV